jgi:GT2 family glycosyltransferase
VHKVSCGAVCAITIPLTIAVIIPVYNATAHLDSCLAALQRSELPPAELIVVDDGSSDGSGEVARGFGATVIRSDERRGPAHARNLGARAAQADIVMFLDADALAHENTLSQVALAFENDPSLDALIGSYDDAPAAQGFVSQYKNLLNHYVHQNSRRRTSNFWGACGAVRRTLFLQQGGFDESYTRPCIEDIEFGYRLAAAGRKIILARSIQVKHLKRWTLGSLIITDIVRRAIPWTALILRYRSLPDDLNLRWSQRLSSVLAFLTVISMALLPVTPRLFLLWIALIAFAASVLVNRDFYSFLARARGWRFAICAAPLHTLYFLYSGLAFVIGLISYGWRAVTGADHAIAAFERRVAKDSESRR